MKDVSKLAVGKKCDLGKRRRIVADGRSVLQLQAEEHLPRCYVVGVRWIGLDDSGIVFDRGKGNGTRKSQEKKSQAMPA